MAAGKYSFIIEQGATLSFELQYKDSTGTPIDLTGYTGRMQIRPSITSNTVLFQMNSTVRPDGTGLNFNGSNGVTPPSSGSIGVYISAYSSSLMTFNEAVYDIEIVSGSTYPVVTRLIEGTVKLSKEVTR